jgi:hypothetical protein
MFAAIRGASSLVSSFAADFLAGLVLVINIRQPLPAAVVHDETRAYIRD